MNKDTATPKPADSEQPSPEGFDDAACSPSSIRSMRMECQKCGGYWVSPDNAQRLMDERDAAREDRDAWKESCANYHAANADLLKERNDMLDLLRRIARKGEFMDREGLRTIVSDWLALRHLLLENSSISNA